MSKMRFKTLAAVITAMALTCTLTGCGQAQPATGNGTSASATESSTVGMDGVITADISFKVSSNTYTIDTFTIGVDEEGNTSVIALGSGFNVLPFKNNKMVVPVWAKIVLEGGIEVDTTGASVSGEGPTFSFANPYEPIAVVFYSGEDETDRYVIDVPAEALP